MLTIISLCISNAVAAPNIQTANLSLYLQNVVRKTPHSEMSDYLEAHRWGSPLLEPVEYPLNKSSDKGVRNAYAGEPNSLETTNFVVSFYHGLQQM